MLNILNKNKLPLNNHHEECQQVCYLLSLNHCHHPSYSSTVLYSIFCSLFYYLPCPSKICKASLFLSSLVALLHYLLIQLFRTDRFTCGYHITRFSSIHIKISFSTLIRSDFSLSDPVLLCESTRHFNPYYDDFTFVCFY